MQEKQQKALDSVLYKMCANRKQVYLQVPVFYPVCPCICICDRAAREITYFVAATRVEGPSMQAMLELGTGDVSTVMIEHLRGYLVERINITLRLHILS